MTHLGSGWEGLADSLKQNRQIDEPPRKIYEVHHPDHLPRITSHPHQCNDVRAIWMTPILYNHQFTCAALLPKCKFIYILDRPENCLDKIKQEGYSERRALAYYDYRLRGMFEYWKRMPWTPFLVRGDDTTLVQEYLGLETKPQW